MTRSFALAGVLAISLVACGGSAAPAGSAAGGKASGGAANPAQLHGADRQKLLEDGAKREGKLTWYTTLIVDQAAQPLADGFKKKYPFISDVEIWRADTNPLAERIVQEYQAKRYDVDVLDGSGVNVLLKDAGALQPFYSPPLDDYPAQLKGADGTWGGEVLYFMTSGYNTKMVSKQEVPKTYEDLLNPKWKGKIGWTTSASLTGPRGFIGNILQVMGETKGMDYLTQLSKQEIRNLDQTSRGVLDQVIAGEFPIALQIFNHHAVISASKGAPADWQPQEPIEATVQGAALAKQPAHPYAAMLFLDYLFAADGGQALLRDVNYLPAHPKVPARVASLKPEGGGYKANYLDPEAGFKNDKKWGQIYQDLFIKK